MRDFRRDVFREYSLHWAIICATVKIRCDDLDAMFNTFCTDLIERGNNFVKFFFCRFMVKMKIGSDEVFAVAS